MEFTFCGNILETEMCADAREVKFIQTSGFDQDSAVFVVFCHSDQLDDGQMRGEICGF